MARVVAGLLLFVSGALLTLGAITATQLRSPFWQKSILFLVIAAIAYAVFWAGRRLWQAG